MLRKSNTRPRTLHTLLTEYRGDSYLYTITANDVFRVYSPVLDDPAWFQLLATLDSRAFAPTTQSVRPKGPTSGPAMVNNGSIWVVNADALRRAVSHALADKPSSATLEVRRKLETLDAEESDVVCWVGKDGRIALRSILVRLQSSSAATLWLTPPEHGPKTANTAQIPTACKRNHPARF